MNWKKRLKTPTPEEEADFKERMASETPLKDKLVMISTAFLVLVLPCALLLAGMGLLLLWMFGAL